MKRPLNKIDDASDEYFDKQEMPNMEDFGKKTRPELIALCKQNGIKGYSAKCKNDLIALLTAVTTVTAVTAVTSSVDCRDSAFPRPPSP